MDRLEEIAARSKLVVDGKHGAALTCDDMAWLCRRLRLAEAVVEAAELVYRAHQHGACMCVKCHALGAALDAWRKEEE